MDVGKLKQTVVFKTNTQTAAESGGFTDSFSELLTTKGYLKKMRGGRNLTSGEIIENNDYELTVRYQPDLTLSQSVRVEIGTRIFSVTGWTKVEEKNFYYVINLNEKIA